MTVGTFPLTQQRLVVHTDVDYTARNGDVIVVHNGAGTQTTSLPANPTDGARVTVGMTGVGNVTVQPDPGGLASVKPLNGPPDLTGVLVDVEGSQAEYIYRAADDTWYAQDTFGGGSSGGASYIGNVTDFAGLAGLTPTTPGDTATTDEGLVFFWNGVTWVRPPSQRTDGAGGDGTYANQTDLPNIDAPRIGDTAVLDNAETYVFNGTSWQQTGGGGAPATIPEEVGEGAALPADGATHELFRLTGHATLPDGLFMWNPAANAWIQT